MGFGDAVESAGPYANNTAPRSRQMTTPTLSFYRPDALPDAQPTVSKHMNCFKKLRWLMRCVCMTGVLPEVHNQGEQLQPDCDESRVWDDWAAADGWDHPTSPDAAPTTAVWAAATVWHSQLYETGFDLLLYFVLNECGLAD